jgi:hypothetical protein
MNPKDEALSPGPAHIPPDTAAAGRGGAALDGGPIPAGVSRGPWTLQEDDSLRTAVSCLGPRNWSDIAKFVPSRTSKQCRERWLNRLSPSLNHGPFESWEDRMIIEKQKDLGNRWATIARLLPGRSAGSVKNRWYSGLNTMAQSSGFDIFEPMNI